MNRFLLAYIAMLVLGLSCSLTNKPSSPTPEPTKTNEIRAPTQTTAQPTPTLTNTCKITANSLNVRSGPGEKYTITGYLYKDELISPPPTLYSGIWLKVDKGYINSKFTDCKERVKQ